MKKLAIITVDYNNHQDTKDWLNSLAKVDKKGFEILTLVVDNGSDTSIKETIKNNKDITWLQTGKNLGFAGGFNQGIRYAKQWDPDLFLLINNDTLFGDESILQNMSAIFNKKETAGVVSPKIYFAPDYEFYKEKYDKKERGKVIWYAGGHFDWNNVRSVHRGIDEVDRGKYDITEKTDFVTGCCMMVKREVLEKVGYFDEKLFAYYEDNDFNERVRKNGFTTWYLGNNYIYHKVSRTAEIGSEFSDYMITRNRLWFGMKWAPRRTKFALIREAIRFLINGRKAQKDGVLDFLNSSWGWKKVKENNNPEYPLDLSIVIVNYNTKKLSEASVNSIFRYKIKPSFEVIVVDNGSTESEKVQAKYPIKFISNSENLGFAKANNQGIDYSLGKHILLLNSDTEVKKDAIDELYYAAEKQKDSGGVVSQLLNPDGSVQGSVFRLPTVVGAISEFWFKQRGQFSKNIPTGNSKIRVEAAVMAAFLITRQALIRVGKLDERYFMFFEDIDYCRKLKHEGLSIYYVPKSKVVHYHGQSGKQITNEANQWRRLNPSSKKYHGLFIHYVIFAILWLEQRIRRWKNSFVNSLTN